MKMGEPITVRIGRTSSYGDKLHIINPTTERAVCNLRRQTMNEKQRRRIKRVPLDMLIEEKSLCRHCWKRYEQLVALGKKSA